MTIAFEGSSLKVGEVFTVDQGETWHTVKDVETVQTQEDEPKEAILITTTEGKKLWVWSDEEVIVR